MAATSLWIVYAFVDPEVALYFGGISALSAFAVGFAAAPRLVRDALKTRDQVRGWNAGAIVTFGAYLVGAPFGAIHAQFTTPDLFGATGFVGVLSDLVTAFGIGVSGLTGGLVFFFPTLLVGMFAGWLFYKIQISRKSVG